MASLVHPYVQCADKDCIYLWHGSKHVELNLLFLHLKLLEVARGWRYRHLKGHINSNPLLCDLLLGGSYLFSFC